MVIYLFLSNIKEFWKKETSIPITKIWACGKQRYIPGYGHSVWTTGLPSSYARWIGPWVSGFFTKLQYTAALHDIRHSSPLTQKIKNIYLELVLWIQCILSTLHLQSVLSGNSTFRSISNIFGFMHIASNHKNLLYNKWKIH